jgi:colanic acid biosynthesis glycosyl transferase WcaI
VKVGILSQWYPPEPGSASIPGVLAEALAERGHRVTVVTGLPNYPLGRLAPGYKMRRATDEVQGPVTIRRVALYPSHDRSKLRRLANYSSFALSAAVSGSSLLRSMDAVWVYNSPATIGLPSAIVSAAGGPPHLMHVMDLWPDSIGYSGLATARTYQAMATLLEHWCQWTYKQAGSIASISRGMLEELESRGVPRAKLHYVPIWTDENQYHPREADNALRQELGGGCRLTILYAGNLGDTQGLDGLLDVCDRTTDLDVRYLIAGSGTAEVRLRAKTERLRLGNVSFLGRWPAEDMGRLLSVADLALVSLSAGELGAMTMPSKLPAILASGRPVVAWASGDVARTVSEGRCGFVADPGDTLKLETAIRDAYHMQPDALAKLGVNASTQYQAKFSLTRGVGAVEDLLVGLATRARPNGISGGTRS